ncbi:MAG: acyl-CoA dehydrogenase [Acidimicrobiales bacterium]|nr:acyl-CoA dehydrogenase [Acidimicrobiales bacterium]
MTYYVAPLADIAFVLEHIVDYPSLAAMPGFEHADLPTVVGVLEECGRFMADVVGPTNRAGDTEGSRWQPDGSVVTPTGFKEAYHRYVEAGWAAVPFPSAYGGGAFPWVIGVAMQELLTSANMAFSLCPLLTQGAIDALLHYGDEIQRETYLPKMVTGEWTGTMNLTEPQAGSDVGALTTRAVRQDDGSYRITGQKIFITYGEHDMASQIVHLVLARTPDAPAGTKGISCFIVPKFLLREDGSPGERNGVSCVSIEHKLGIHGSPTCVLAYEDAVGYLIGEENMGMRIMFVMMNNARLSVGLEGLALAERAYQQALQYAQDRIQGKAVGSSAKESPIIEHADVRRMLMTQKAYIEALRCLILLNAGHIDRSNHHPDEAVRARSSEIVGLLTPICKGFGTDMGVELTSLAVQIHGGMGYVEETGVAQHFRDSRIAPIYEGTNGIQAADLVARKLPMRGGASVQEFLASMRSVDGELAEAGEAFASIRKNLAQQLDTLEEATAWVLSNGAADPNAALAGSSPLLRQWGLCVGGWLLARSALAAAGTGNAVLAENKLVTARFYAEQLLPRAGGLLASVTAGARDLFALPADRLHS